MKKIIIYLLLSLILVVPIATMAAIAIVNSGETEYSLPTTFSNNFDGVETDFLLVSTLKEELVATGRFISTTNESLEVVYKSEERLYLYYTEGEFIPKGSIICIADGVEYSFDQDCFLAKIETKEKSIRLLLHTVNVNALEALLPIETYYYINNSALSFAWGTEQYNNLKCTNVSAYAQDTGEFFTAQYAVDGDDLLFGGCVEVTIETGRVVENALSAPVNCFFLEEDGRYYIEVFSEGKASKVYVDIGIIGQGRAEIINADNEKLAANTRIVVNNKNILTAKDNSKHQDE